MFKNVSWGIKIVAAINTIVNLLLLFPLFFTMFPPFKLRLSIIIANILLGVGLILLDNWARRLFIAIQIPNLILSIWPFGCILTLGLGSAGAFGDDHILWAPAFTPLFWQQLLSFMLGMLFPAIPMLLSMFYILYFTIPKVKEQFK